MDVVVGGVGEVDEEGGGGFFGGGVGALGGGEGAVACICGGGDVVVWEEGLAPGLGVDEAGEGGGGRGQRW